MLRSEAASRTATPVQDQSPRHAQRDPDSSQPKRLGSHYIDERSHFDSLGWARPLGSLWSESVLRHNARLLRAPCSTRQLGGQLLRVHCAQRQLPDAPATM